MDGIYAGKDVFPDGIYRLDVRDVVNAHILAFENPKANGRYCMIGTMSRSWEIMKIVHKHYPALTGSHSQRCKDSKCVESLPCNVLRERVEGLGIDFTPLEASIMDLKSLKENNFLTI